MSPIRYNNPFKELDELQTQLSRLFDQSWTASPSPGVSLPTADVYMDQDDQNLFIEAQLPGYSEDEVELQLENGALIIRADREERHKKEDGRKYILKESSSNYYRRIGLPKNVKSDGVEADFDNGILRVSIPFKELPKPKSIKIGNKKTKKE